MEIPEQPGETESGEREPGQHELDRLKVKKAADYLLHHQRAHVKKLRWIHLELQLWRTPTQRQVLYIPLPHKFLRLSHNCCLLVKVEADASIQQTQEFYEEFFRERGVSQEMKIFPLEISTKHRSGKIAELKRYMIFADAKIRSQVEACYGDIFCCKCVRFLDLESGDLAAELNLHYQSSRVNIGIGRKCAIAVGDTMMELEDLVENILGAARVLAEKFPLIWRNVGSLALSDQNAIYLPIYSSAAGQPEELVGETETIKEAEEVADNSAVVSEPVPSVCEESGGDLEGEKKDIAPQTEADNTDIDLDPAAPHKEPENGEKRKL